MGKLSVRASITLKYPPEQNVKEGNPACLWIVEKEVQKLYSASYGDILYVLGKAKKESPHGTFFVSTSNSC